MKLSIAPDTLNSLKSKYRKLPKNSMEFGGILCGYTDKFGNTRVVNSVDIPSAIGKGDSYSFNTHILKYGNQCSPYHAVAVWHTHPEYSPFPSREDREVSGRIKTMGCVLTNGLQCFFGDKDVEVNIK